MRRLLLIKVVVLLLIATPVWAQQTAAERAANLRAQLADLQAQEVDLQTRLAQIDEEMKPENIERSLAGVGSTHPEDLRAARRRQFEIRRKGIQAQLDTIAATRSRLETAIAIADSETSRPPAGPNAIVSPIVSPSVSTATPTTKKASQPRKKQKVK